MREVVFVSEDAEWDIDDPILGTLEREIDLAPGAQQAMMMSVDVLHTYKLQSSGEVSEILPGIPPGAYYAIVRTDITNAIRETDVANNTSTSEAAMVVDVPVLTPGVPETFALAAGEARYYRLVAAPDQDIRVSLSTDEPDASNEIYAAFERPPVAGGDFDAAAAAPFTANQTLLLPATDAGTYFLLVMARGLPGDAVSETVTLAADILGFQVTGISPDVGGQGQVTTTVTGGGFREGDRVFLRDGGRTAFGEILESASTE